jgi:hypothetical protein
MALFLTILEGENASDARPILASRDEHLISVVASELAKRFKLPGQPTKQTLISLDRKLRSSPETGADKEDPRHG